MAKRGGSGSRVTPRKRYYPAGVDGPPARRRPETSASRRQALSNPRPGPQRQGDRAGHPAGTGRYTPPRDSHRLRPRWHRIAGWAGVAFGVLIAALNDLTLMTDPTELLPFGHSELYLILAVVVAGASSWFLGLFDRGTTIFE